MLYLVAMRKEGFGGKSWKGDNAGGENRRTTEMKAPKKEE